MHREERAEAEADLLQAMHLTTNMVPERTKALPRRAPDKNYTAAHHLLLATTLIAIVFPATSTRAEGANYPATSRSRAQTSACLPIAGESREATVASPSLPGPRPEA